MLSLDVIYRLPDTVEENLALPHPQHLRVLRPFLLEAGDGASIGVACLCK